MELVPINFSLMIPEENGFCLGFLWEKIESSFFYGFGFSFPLTTAESHLTLENV